MANSDGSTLISPYDYLTSVEEARAHELVLLNIQGQEYLLRGRSIQNLINGKREITKGEVLKVNRRYSRGDVRCVPVGEKEKATISALVAKQDFTEGF